MHTPVLLQESIEALDIKEGAHYVDATFGQGGHTTAILKKGGIVLAIDQDKEQISKFETLNSKTENLTLANANYSEIESVVENNNFKPVSGILFDLGLSMEQLSGSKKGFSFKDDAEVLDMRLTSDIEDSASDVLNYLSVESLYDILAKYSETLFSRQFAEAIVRARTVKKMETVGDLKNIIQKVLYQNNQTQRHDKVYAQVFQALRIVVNDEFGHIKQGLRGSWNVLEEKGRLVVITFHSGEDRIVKWESKKIGFKEVNHKLVKGKLKFERSAKMRVFEKV